MKPTIAAKLSQCTPTMREAYNLAERNGGKLHRHAGGFWADKTWNGADRYALTATVREMISRGFFVESGWDYPGIIDRFCVEVTTSKVEPVGVVESIYEVERRNGRHQR